MLVKKSEFLQLEQKMYYKFIWWFVAIFNLKKRKEKMKLKKERKKKRTKENERKSIKKEKSKQSKAKTILVVDKNKPRKLCILHLS